MATTTNAIVGQAVAPLAMWANMPQEVVKIEAAFLDIGFVPTQVPSIYQRFIEARTAPPPTKAFTSGDAIVAGQQAAKVATGIVAASDPAAAAAINNPVVPAATGSAIQSVPNVFTPQGCEDYILTMTKGIDASCATNICTNDCYTTFATTSTRLSTLFTSCSPTADQAMILLQRFREFDANARINCNGYNVTTPAQAVPKALNEFGVQISNRTGPVVPVDIPEPVETTVSTLQNPATATLQAPTNKATATTIPVPISSAPSTLYGIFVGALGILAQIFM